MIRDTALAKKTFLGKVIFACLTFSGLTALKTYPLILRLHTHVPSDPGDPLLVTWILAWGFHALKTQPFNLFNANILYPVKHALAFSEHMLGVLPIFAPFYILTDNPIFAYNLVFFLSFALSGITMFALVHYWTQNLWASLLSGCLFAFSPIRFGQLGHLHLLNFYWAPLALLFLEKAIRTKNWCPLVGFCIFYWAQVLSSVYLGWFITVAVTLYLFYSALLTDKDLLSRTMIWRYGIVVISSVLVLLPIHLPYFMVRSRWGAPWGVDQAVFFSADLMLSYLSTSPLSNNFYATFLRFAQSSSGGHEKWLFPGLVLPILVAVGSFSVIGTPACDSYRKMKQFFWLLIASSFVLSLGPYLVIFNQRLDIPLPYLALYHLVPGFNAMRAPARFGLMVVLAASVLAALGVLRASHYLHTYLRCRRLTLPTCQGILALCFLGLFILELGFKPLPLVRVPTGQEVPEVYRWLAAAKFKGPIVELPFGFWPDFQYAYFSTYHWQPLVNGSTGFIPPTYFGMIPELHALPSPRSVEYLSAIGVRALVVHTAMLSSEDAVRWHAPEELAEMGLEKVAEFGADVVYRIRTVETTHRLQLEPAIPDRLPAGTETSLGVLAKGRGPRPWSHPRPLGQTAVIAEWKEVQTSWTSTETTRLLFPLVILAGEAAPIRLSIRTPSTGGQYTLQLHFPSFDISTVPNIVEVTTEP